MNDICRITAAAIAIVLLFHAGSAGATAEDRAEAILETTTNSGGLIVHLECGDGRLTAELGRSGRFIVRGLETDADDIRKARKHIAGEGLYGRTSVGQWDGKRIPMMDNSVNILVCDKGSSPGETELRRVLAPGGRVALGGEGFIKSRPDEIDEWTHFLHGPDNNAVARDEIVGPPARLQWICDPIHLRTHEHLNSVSAVVSAKGRLIYIIDEGSTSAVIGPPEWKLVARDAFNGCLLWKQNIGPWEGHFRLFRSGPAAIARRLVAVDDEVYVTKGYGRQVAAFNAATGGLLREYKGSEGGLEIICNEGVLYVMVGDMKLDPPADPAKRYYPQQEAMNRGIVAIDTESGDLLWKRKDRETATIMPTAMAVSDGRLFFQNTRRLLCLDTDSGKTRWRVDNPIYTTRLSWSAPVLVACDGVVLVADGSSGGLKARRKGDKKVRWILSDRDIRRHPVGTLRAFSADDGKEIWDGESLQGFCNPGDLFVVDGKVWAGADVGSGQALLNKAIDLKTGKVVSKRPNRGWPVGGHTRCYRNKATQRYLILGDIGVDFVDVNDWSWNANPWVRGTCQYGVLPCNGLLYVPPDSCACRPAKRLHGFTAMAPENPQDNDKPATAKQLHKGPAYAEAAEKVKAGSSQPAWPTYRNDIARSGRTGAPVPTKLKRAWRKTIGGGLTSLTIGNGMVFVSRRDTHTVHALNAKNGDIVWSRIAGGVVDSPPTICGELVIFGCHDGYVYCLDADNGEEVWRFRAAPREQFIVAMKHVESSWPVKGSVLVRDNRVWFAAGRSPYLDDGVFVYALDVPTGEVVAKKRIISRGAQRFRKTRRGRPGDLTPPEIPDILSADDELVYMRTMGFNKNGEIVKTRPHLFSATGFLDDTWWHRTYWQYGTWMRGGFGGWPQAARTVPAGRIMAVADDDLFSFSRSQFDAGNGGNVYAGHVGTVKQDYQHMGRIDHESNPYRLSSAKKLPGVKKNGGRKRKTVLYNWSVPVPLLVRAMVLADGTLFVAGPPADAGHKSLINLGVNRTGILQAISTTDGKRISEHELKSTPVFDGMAAMPGQLVISCTDGSVYCLTGDRR